MHVNIIECPNCRARAAPNEKTVTECCLECNTWLPDYKDLHKLYLELRDNTLKLCRKVGIDTGTPHPIREYVGLLGQAIEEDARKPEYEAALMLEQELREKEKEGFFLATRIFDEKNQELEAQIKQLESQNELHKGDVFQKEQLIRRLNIKIKKVREVLNNE